MISKSVTSPPSIQRRRPIDASGLFWSLVSILAGFFYGGIYSAVLYFVFGVLAFLGIVWQFKMWAWDSTINRQATEWCRIHYPEFGGTPIVDLMVAMGHILGIQFATLAPSTPLVDLVLPPDGTNDCGFIRLSEMLQCVVHEARIRRLDCSTFAGSTLDDAIKFVIESSAQRNAPKIAQNQ